MRKGAELAPFLQIQLTTLFLKFHGTYIKCVLYISQS